jgi:hypothetical protein
MEITFGRNPPGAVTVDFRRADALAKLLDHSLLVRSFTDVGTTRATPPEEVPAHHEFPRRAPSGMGAASYGHLISEFARGVVNATPGEASSKFLHVQLPPSLPARAELNVKA